MKKTIFIIIIIFISLTSYSQNPDSLVVRKFFNAAMTDTTSYNNLRHLCTNIGGRLCGSPQAEKAVQWAKKVLEGMNLDTVFLQETKLKHWVRGREEVIVNPKQASGYKLHACAIGGSVPTPANGITSKVIEVYDYDDLKKLGKEKIAGKIIFFNHPANPAIYYTFGAYGEAVKFRATGASEAAKYGAVAVIVRSATLAHDNFPHTGVMHYKDSVPQIPAMCVSTNDADKLSKALKKDPSLNIFMRVASSEQPEAISYNVIGEIRGTEMPDDHIIFGGHLDAWDNGQGANDDGSGVVQTIEILRLFKALNIKPKRTIRVVVFMDEEMDQRGAKTYAEYAMGKSHAMLPSSKFKIPSPEYHIAAIEADRGGTTPFGFSIDASDDQYGKIKGWKELFSPYGLYMFDKGGSGVDVGKLKPLGTALIALVTDSQRYFDYHHSANDSFDHISQRELQLGSFAMAALVYLIDEYGL
ncbi:MAG: M20/M25/M40 family metallo-hydrolase [Bacteroidota bacterium]